MFQKKTKRYFSLLFSIILTASLLLSAAPVSAEGNLPVIQPKTVVEQANSAIDTEALDVLEPVAPSDSPAYTASQITDSGNTWTLENDVMKAVVSFANGSLTLDSLYNKEAGTEYLTGSGDNYLFSYKYGNHQLRADDGGWTLTADAEENIMMNQTHVGKSLQITLSRTSPDPVQIKLVFEIYDGRSGLRYQNFIKNNSSSNKTISESDVIALNFPNHPHVLHYVPNMTWTSTTGSLQPNTGRNAITVYNAGHGWGLQPEVNWKTQEGPAVYGSRPSSVNMLPPFASVNAWHGIDGVKVSTNPESLQLVLFPGEEFEYIAVNLTVFNGDIVEGKMAVEEHFRKRFKYNQLTALFNTNDWEWKNKRNVPNYHYNVVIPKAKQAGFDMVMLDDMWNQEDYFGNRDGITPVAGIGNLRTLADAIEANDMILGLWYSMSGGFHNGGRDLADPVMIAQKKALVKSLIEDSHMAHQMIDLTEYWQNPNITSYSHPSDNVYRKNVLVRNMLNELVTEYPQYRPKITSEIDIYPSQNDRNNGLLHIGYNGWVTANGDSGGGIRLSVNSFGYMPMGSTYVGGVISGKMEDYYSYMLARNVKFPEDPGDPNKWPEHGIELMAKFNEWRKSNRIKTMTEELYRPVYSGQNWDSTGWNNNGPYAWMHTDDARSKALVIATGGRRTASSQFQADLRWLAPGKHYLVEDITLDDNGDHTYRFKGLLTGNQLQSFNIDLSENSSRGKAFWIQEFGGQNYEAFYADEKTDSYQLSVNGQSLNITATGKPNSTGRIFIYGKQQEAVMIVEVSFNASGQATQHVPVFIPTEDYPVDNGPRAATYIAATLYESGQTNVSGGTQVRVDSGVTPNTSPYGLIFQANNQTAGGYIELKIDVAKPGLYKVDVASKLNNSRGKGQWYIDGVKVGNEWNQNEPADIVKVHNLGNVFFDTPGIKTLRFNYLGGSGKALHIDRIMLDPVEISEQHPAVYRAFQLYDTGKVSAQGGALMRADSGITPNTSPFGVILTSSTSQAGSYMEFELNVLQSGFYNVDVVSKLNNSRGKGQWYIDGVKAGAEWNQNEPADTVKTHNLGSSIYLSAGIKKFKFVFLGGDKKALQADRFILSPTEADPIDPSIYRAYQLFDASKITAQEGTLMRANSGVTPNTSPFGVIFTSSGSQAGGFMEFELNVEKSGYYKAEVAAKLNNSRGKGQWYINGVKAGNEWNQNEPADIVKTHNLSSSIYLPAGVNKFKFVFLGGDKRALQADRFILTPQPSVARAYQLFDTNKVKAIGGTLSRADSGVTPNTSPFGVIFSSTSSQAGSYMEFEVTAKYSGIYKIEVASKLNNSRGKGQWYIDGVKAGAEWNQNEPNDIVKIHNLGNAIQLNAGTHKFKFVFLGGEKKALQADRFIITPLIYL